MSKVSVIITSYLPESKPYLDLCVASIKNLATRPYEVIIVGRPDYLPQYYDVQTVAPKEVKFAPPVGLNCGIAHASRNSDFLFIINDDTIVTKHCLDALVDAYVNTPNLGLLMPIGNDQQQRYALDVHIPPGPYKYDQLSWMAPKMMNLDSKYDKGLILCDTLCLYAMLMSKKVWQAIGPFDEALIGQDDIDYSYRSRKLGLVNAISLSALCYHFGGVSADKTFDQEMRQKSIDLFNKKWWGTYGGVAL